MEGSVKNLSRLAGNWDPATFRSTCFPDVPGSSLGAVVGAAITTVDPDVTPEDRALQVRNHLPAAQPGLQTLWVGIGMLTACLWCVKDWALQPSALELNAGSVMCARSGRTLVLMQASWCCCVHCKVY